MSGVSSDVLRRVSNSQRSFSGLQNVAQPSVRGHDRACFVLNRARQPAQARVKSDIVAEMLQMTSACHRDGCPNQRQDPDLLFGPYALTYRRPVARSENFQFGRSASRSGSNSIPQSALCSPGWVNCHLGVSSTSRPAWNVYVFLVCLQFFRVPSALALRVVHLR